MKNQLHYHLLLWQAGMPFRKSVVIIRRMLSENGNSPSSYFSLLQWYCSALMLGASGGVGHVAIQVNDTMNWRETHLVCWTSCSITWVWKQPRYAVQVHSISFENWVRRMWSIIIRRIGSLNWVKSQSNRLIFPFNQQARSAFSDTTLSSTLSAHDIINSN